MSDGLTQTEDGRISFAHVFIGTPVSSGEQDLALPASLGCTLMKPREEKKNLKRKKVTKRS